MNFLKSYLTIVLALLGFLLTTCFVAFSSFEGRKNPTPLVFEATGVCEFITDGNGFFVWGSTETEGEIKIYSPNCLSKGEQVLVFSMPSGFQADYYTVGHKP